MSGLFRGIHNWIVAGRRRAELDRIDSSELNRIAGETGVSVSELGDLVEEGADAAALLPRRLHVERMDASAIARAEPATMRDMQRVCSHCGHHERCERDLEGSPDDPAWQSYCPNAQTMRALKASAN